MDINHLKFEGVRAAFVKPGSPVGWAPRAHVSQPGNGLNTQRGLVRVGTGCPPLYL